MGNVDQVGIQPFGRYQQSIQRHGVDAALMRAAGLRLDSELDEHQKQTLLQRVRRFFAGSAAASHDKDDQRHGGNCTQMNAWLCQVEQYYAETSVEELQRFVVHRPDDLACHAALALRYTEMEDWPEAIAQYTAALGIAPDFAPLYGRRAAVHFASSNRQAALTDWNKAIELAPLEPWFFVYRSQLYADLEAWPQAESDLDSACALAPREPATFLARAGIRLAMGSYLAAIEDLKRVLQLDPNSGRAHLHLGWIHQQAELQDLNMAIDHLTRAIDLMPSEVEPRAQRSVVYAFQNKFELALEDCDALIEMKPDLGLGYGVRGRILQMQGEFSEAIEACTRAIDLGMETSSVLLARGLAYAATDQPELALSDCNAAIALDPDNPLAYQLRGMLSMQRGELDTAMEALMKARDIAPEWAGPREQLALLHRITENPQAAVEEQSILVAQQPKSPEHYVNRAFAYTQLGSYEDAKRDYDRACELDPENEDILYLRGCFLMDRQEAEAALRDFEHVLAIADDHDDARFRRAAILLQLKRHTEALGDFGKLIAKYPDDPRAYTGRAYTHQVIGNELAADADLDQLMRIIPEKSQEMTIQSLSGKVRWLESQDRYDEAIEVSEEIIEIAPEDTTGYELRAWIRWYTEQYVEAYDDYTRLLEMKPDDPSVLNSRGQVQAEMGDCRSALDDLDASIERSREAGQTQLLAFALNGRALALAELDRMDESTRDYEESLRLCPTNAWAYYNRGVVMYRRGDHSEAKKLFEIAIQSSAPPLTKRKRDRAQALLDKT
jgi:tetratricopeptide (TPR) repeat protein